VIKISVPGPLRRRTRERAAGRCEYCLLAEDDAFFPHEPDHIISVKHGGASTMENLAWSCFDCNRFKGSDIASYDAVTQALVPLFHPRKHRWNEHFLLAEGQILPLTSIGRVTAALLKLNLPQRAEVRKILEKIRRHS
jgi:hypothetical protein